MEDMELEDMVIHVALAIPTTVQDMELMLF
jgi:hypothetical protein